MTGPRAKLCAKTLAVAALAVAAGLGVGPAKAAVGAFLPHQAQYDLGLVKARGIEHQ